MAALTRHAASRRARKGWQTRRKQGGQSRVTRSRTQNSYTWHRPNEKVKLTGFTPSQVRVVKPALIATDKTLQPHIKLHTNIEVKRVPGRRSLGGQRQRLLRKNEIRVAPQAFKSRRYNPAGVLTHEIGHAVGPVNRRTPLKQSSRYMDEFGWRGPKKATKRSLMHKKKTRQSQDMFEDFAETYRGLTGIPITKKHNRYFDVQTNKRRQAFMNRHYVNA